MARPLCPLHPHSRVQRYGRYGKRRQYVRWQCIPQNGDRPHMLRPELSSKQHGGPSGDCLECERPWDDTDGMPAGTRDRFTLREKTATLRLLADGVSYREASNEARKRGGYSRTYREMQFASRDGRLAGDWVSQYAAILAEHYLPDRWPRMLCLDHLPIHVRDTKSNRPKQSGVVTFNILGASSYVGDRAVLWKVEASRTRTKNDWLRFLSSMPGRPHWVVTDRNDQIWAAVAEHWPQTRIYACTKHLVINVETHLRDAGLNDRRRRINKALHNSTFTDAGAYVAFRNTLFRYLAADLSAMSSRQCKALRKLDRWLRANEDHIAQSLVENHWPVTVGSLEQPLRVVKSAIFDRRASLRNMDRLNDLLKLIQLKQMGSADEREWARILRDNHRVHAGKPPPRRLVDDPALRPR